MSEHPLSAPQDLTEERVLRRIPLEIAIVAVVLAAASLLIFPPRTGVFILAGGLFSALSFIWLRRSIGRFLSPDRRRSVRSGLTLYLVRLILLLAIFSFIIVLFPRMILAFVAGFSSLVLAVLAEAGIAISQMKKWKG